MSDDDILDCAIIGGGPAGLTAATYLARYKRRVRVFDSGASRLLWIPTSHNYPGYAHGIHGRDLLEKLRGQSGEYGVAIEPCPVLALEKQDDGVFLLRSGGSGSPENTHDGGRLWRARFVLLATGVMDVEPAFPNVKEALAAGTLRYCPVCDGYEARERKVAVIGRGAGGVGESMFVRHFASSVDVFSTDEPMDPDSEQLAKLNAADVRARHERVTSIAYDAADHAIWLELDGGARERYDVLYSALGTLVNTGLAQLLGARTAANGEVLVDEHLQTSVDGLYAAGDIVAGLNQIAVAMGHAAIATTAIHNRLRV